MIFCVGGVIHGAIDRFYADVLTFEAALGVRFEAVLHVGDFGIWPDPSRLDRATREHDGAGDFGEWLETGRAAPRPTIFIKGNHEDFDWLEGRNDSNVLPGLAFLPNGQVRMLGQRRESIAVGGIGGCYGPRDYATRSDRLRGAELRHYTRDEVDRLCKRGKLDVLLLHDAPVGVEIVQRSANGRERRYVSEAVGLDEVVARTRPRVCFFGHHHAWVDAEVEGVPCLGLNLVGRPGNLVGVEVHGRDRDWTVLGRWPC